VLARWAGLPVAGSRRIGCHDVAFGESVGRLWAPDRPGPGLVLVAGVTPRGNDDPRLDRLARALGRSGWVVFSPVLALVDKRLDPADIEQIVGAVRGVHGHAATRGDVTALGFSFGGSYLLVAAGDPRLRGLLRSVGAFGAYAHLANLLPEARSADRDEIRRFLDATTGPGSMIGQEEREALERVLVAGEGLEELPADLTERMNALSPASVADPLAIPVSLIHAIDDPVIPAREMDRLAEVLPGARTHRVRVFTHVDFRPTPRRLVDAFRDLVEVHRFTAEVLGQRTR
jgi:acetyl esterase/lipase